MTQCSCDIPYPDLLQADEGWHCTRCGWPVPADGERVKREIEVRTLARKLGVSPYAPIFTSAPHLTALRESIDTIETDAAIVEALCAYGSVQRREELERLWRRGRRISLIGFVVSLILIAMSLAQVFGLVGRPPPLPVTVFFCFVFAVTIGLIIMARQQIRMLRKLGGDQ